jgi:hypothetical protein
VGAILSAASLAGLVALAHTDLPRKARDYLAVTVPKIKYPESQPYVVKPGDTIERLSSGNRSVKEYLIQEFSQSRTEG